MGVGGWREKERENDTRKENIELLNVPIRRLERASENDQCDTFS
jgi:hypothetical protein